jgi:hypothetical protein
MVAVAILAELLESSGRPDLAYEVLVKTYNAGGDERDPGRRVIRGTTISLAGVCWSGGDSTVTYYGRKARREGYDSFTANNCLVFAAGNVGGFRGRVSIDGMV